MFLRVLCASAVGSACERQQLPASLAPPWFEECARERGLVFVHASGHREAYWIPEIVGGGAALLDMEGDGDLDAYLVQGGSLYPDATPAQLANALFENVGEGRFRDATAGSGAEDPRYGMGAACADADGDGDTDILVTNLGRNTLLRNEGGGRFEDATEAAGTVGTGWSTSAAFLDHDRDGALDLFVARYLDWSPEKELVCTDARGQADYCSPKRYKAPARDLLFHNEGGGRFADVSKRSGVWEDPGTGLGVAAGDLDEDGWLDVFVANDAMPNHLWKNYGRGRFANEAMLRGCGVDSGGLPKGGMGTVLADLDGDLDLDVLVVNLSGESDSLYRNEGGHFVDGTAAAGLSAPGFPSTRFGLAAGDFDLDGYLDLFEASGRVERAREPAAEDPYAEPDLLLAGLPGGRFAQVLPRGGTREPLIATGRAVAQGDLDGDGALDLLVVNRDGPAHLLFGRAPRGGSWILLHVLERTGADALGAALEIELGARRVRRDVAPNSGYLASHDPRVHLGLGSAQRVDGVRVRWGDGTMERFGPLEAGREHALRRGEGELVPGGPR